MKSTAKLSVLSQPTLKFADHLYEPQTLKAGEKLVLDGVITGVPTPTTTWTFNNAPLQAADHVFVEIKDTSTKVTFVDVTLSESGTYKVQAENTVGMAEQEFSITVKGIFCFFI